MYRVLIADDERLSRDRLRRMLSQFTDFDIVCEAANADEVAQCIEKCSIDVAFLDIEMPGRSIFSLLADLSYKPYIVFQTAYSEFAVEAFEYDAIDYLLKPISTVRMDKCVDKIRKVLTVPTENKSKYNGSFIDDRKGIITLKNGNEIKLINVSDICSIVSENGITKITMTNGDIYFSDKYLTHFEGVLPEAFFIRSSRTGIINISSIKTIKIGINGGYEVEMKIGDFVSVSRRCGIELKRILGI